MKIIRVAAAIPVAGPMLALAKILPASWLFRQRLIISAFRLLGVRE